MTVIYILLTADSSDKGTVSRTTSSVKTEFAIRLGAGPDVERKSVQLRACGDMDGSTSVPSGMLHRKTETTLEQYVFSESLTVDFEIEMKLTDKTMTSKHACRRT